MQNRKTQIDWKPILWIIGLYILETISGSLVYSIGHSLNVTFITSLIWIVSKIVPLIVILIVFRGKFREFIDKTKSNVPLFLLFTFISFLAFYLTESGTSYYSLVMDKLFGVGDTTNQAAIYGYFKESSSFTNYSLLFVTVVILAPIIEELEFRVLVFDIFKKSHFIIPAIASALLFGFIHLDYTNLTLQEISYFPVYCIPGFVLALIYHYNNRNAFSDILVHMAINLIAYVQIVQGIAGGAI